MAAAFALPFHRSFKCLLSTADQNVKSPCFCNNLFGHSAAGEAVSSLPCGVTCETWSQESSLVSRHSYHSWAERKEKTFIWTPLQNYMVAIQHWNFLQKDSDTTELSGFTCICICRSFPLRCRIYVRRVCKWIMQGNLLRFVVQESCDMAHLHSSWLIVWVIMEMICICVL